jgi:hypothetical protein
MAKTPKTLQVSLGSFSCTLEGFDDPVPAMKAVTEYLRDLTARDPAFAARIGLLAEEPAVPPRSTVADPAPPPPPEPAQEGPVLAALFPTPPVSTPPVPAPPAPVAAQPPPTPPPAAQAPLPPVGQITEWGEEDEPELDPAAHPGLQKLRAALPEDEEEEEEELSRFLSRADDQLADPEAARRRDVIAQLKAAVAATEAERALGDPEPAHDARQGAFRLDLSEAVRDQPPLPGARPEPAPLRLVASQRVDEDPLPLEDDDGEEEAAVPARRQGSFAVFATEMQATSLHDLLEAAAAWLCFVDEAESVSRAQLLALVAGARGGVAPDREEGLRAFGTLLRQGRIVAVAGGRYRISDGSRFDPSRLAG